MTQEEKLDVVLSNLAQHNADYEKVYESYFADEEIKKELPVLLGQIIKDGFATAKEINDPEIHEGYGHMIDVYRITNEGLLFHKKSSYKQKLIKDRKKKYWSLIEKVSVAVNAILLLIIAVGGLYVSNKANEDKEENKQLKQRIDSLTAILQNQRNGLHKQANKSAGFIQKKDSLKQR